MQNCSIAEWELKCDHKRMRITTKMTAINAKCFAFLVREVHLGPFFPKGEGFGLNIISFSRFDCEADNTSAFLEFMFERRLEI